VFDRSRRTVSGIRKRYFRKGRHRRPTTPVPALATSLEVRQCREPAGVLVGEEVALVRPYVWAIGEHARRCSAVAPCPPVAGSRFVEMGDR
jgi:hypothetical protein